METFSRHVEIKHEILLFEADLAHDTSCLRCSQNRLRESDLATAQYATYATNMFYNGNKSLSTECALIRFFVEGLCAQNCYAKSCIYSVPLIYVLYFKSANNAFTFASF